MTPQRYKYLLIFFGIAFSVVVSNSGTVRRWFDPSYPLLADAPRVSAIAGDWALTNLEWVDYLGSWRIDTTVVRTGGRPPPQDNHAIIQALCGVILTELPGALPDGVTRQDVFRVSLNFWQVEDGEISFIKVYPTPIPVSVLNGSCQPHEGEDFYALTYPGRAYPWSIQNIALALDGSDQDYQAHFHWQETGMGPFEQFPYADACQYVLLDVPDFFHYIDITALNNLTVHAGSGRIEGEIIETIGGFQEFLIVDDQCIPVPAVEGDSL